MYSIYLGLSRYQSNYSISFHPSRVIELIIKYFEHFYSDLKPWVHYVPVKADLSDLIEKIRWAKNNDDKAKKIVNNAQKFVLGMLDSYLP